MFQPNSKCIISSAKSDEYGMPLAGAKFVEGCTVVKLKIVNEKSSVRADSSASRGNAREFESDANILLTKNTKAKIDDLIELPECKLRIVSKMPRRNLQGVLDHYEVTAQFWSKV